VRYAMLGHTRVLPSPQTVNVVFSAVGAPDKNLAVPNDSFQDRYSLLQFHFLSSIPPYLFLLAEGDTGHRQTAYLQSLARNLYHHMRDMALSGSPA